MVLAIKPQVQELLCHSKENTVHVVSWKTVHNVKTSGGIQED